MTLALESSQQTTFNLRGLLEINPEFMNLSFKAGFQSLVIVLLSPEYPLASSSEAHFIKVVKLFPAMDSFHTQVFFELRARHLCSLWCASLAANGRHQRRGAKRSASAAWRVRDPTTECPTE